NATVIGSTRLTSADEFREILVKVNEDGSQVRVKDVAEVGLGADNYSISGNFNGTPSAGIALRLAPGGNLLETVDNVRAVLDAQEPFLPDGVKIIYPYDPTPVVEASISSVVMTILEAILLVFLVMYLFLQSFRPPFIPTLAVLAVLPVASARLLLFGLNINALTSSAAVSEFGLLVDAAMVVVENVERLMHEERLSSLVAYRKSMHLIMPALVGMGM